MFLRALPSLCENVLAEANAGMPSIVEVGSQPFQWGGWPLDGEQSGARQDLALGAVNGTPDPMITKIAWAFGEPGTSRRYRAGPGACQEVV